MNSLKLLGQMYPTWVLEQQIHYQLALLHQTGKDIHFLWTPSHQGIDGNDQADAAAKLAIIHPTSTLIPHSTGSDVKLHLKERLYPNRQITWNSTTSPLKRIKPSITNWVHTLALLTKG